MRAATLIDNYFLLAEAAEAAEASEAAEAVRHANDVERSQVLKLLGGIMHSTQENWHTLMPITSKLSSC